MWCCKRVSADADHASHAELHADVGDRFGEEVPVSVGFWAGEQQNIFVVDVATERDLGCRPNEFCVDAIAKLHDRATGAKIYEGVNVEIDDLDGACFFGDEFDCCGRG